MVTTSHEGSPEPSLRTDNWAVGAIRSLRGWLNVPSAQDQAFIDHKFGQYLDTAEAHGIGSSEAQSVREQLGGLPWAIRKELTRLCDLYDRRHAGSLSAGMDGN